MVAFEYAVNRSTLHKCYKALFSLVAKHVTNALTMVVDINKVEHQFHAVQEYLALCEGMLPLGEMTFLKHEMIHWLRQNKEMELEILY